MTTHDTKELRPKFTESGLPTDETLDAITYWPNEDPNGSYQRLLK